MTSIWRTVKYPNTGIWKSARSGTVPTGQTVGMTQLDDLRIVQRTSTTGGGQGKGQGSVTIPLTVTGSTPIYARRRSVVDGSTVVQGPWIANAAATSGNVVLTGIDVPAMDSTGAPTASKDGWSYLDVATSPSGPWTSGTSRIAVGRLTMISGQSLAVRMIGRQDSDPNTNASLGVSINPYTSVLATYRIQRNAERWLCHTVDFQVPGVHAGNYRVLVHATDISSCFPAVLVHWPDVQLHCLAH